MLPTATDLDDPDGFVHREHMDFSELDKMLADSAAAGDPRARSMQIELELSIARRTQGRDNTQITDAQIDALKQALSSKDPETIRVAGRVLSNSYADYQLRIGPQQAAVEPRAEVIVPIRMRLPCARIRCTPSLIPAMTASALAPEDRSLMPSSQMTAPTPDSVSTSRSRRASADGPPGKGQSGA